MQKEKATRTPAQKRLDSQLVYAIRRKRGEMSKDIPREIDVKIREDGRVLVDLDASVSKELLSLIEQQGGQIINNFPAQNAIRALVPLANLETVAAQTGVRFIRPAVGASTQK
jgi:hypothetical protein